MTHHNIFLFKRSSFLTIDWFAFQDEASDDEAKKEEIFSTSHGETESES